MRDAALLEVFETALRERLVYDAETGVITWCKPDRARFATLNAYRTWSTRFGGKPAGRIRTDGYIGIRITLGSKTTVLLAHRVAWFLSYGCWPSGQVDHINGVRVDNRLHNLRDVTAEMNRRNMKCNRRSKTGVSGVTWSKHANRWLVRVNFGGKTKNLGYYHDFDSAVAARLAAAAEHGYHPNHSTR